MKSFFYSGMVFQILVGLWLFISPFVPGFWEAHLTFNNMIFGAIVCLLGVGSILHELYHKEEFESKDTLPKMGQAKQRT